MKRIMVGLDLTASDKPIIKYTAFLSRIIHPEKIYFIYVDPDLEVPEYVDKKISDWMPPKDESAVRHMHREIQGYFKGADKAKISFEVLEGSATKVFLHWVNVKKVDLLVVGRKKSQGRGILPKQLTRAIRASVLFVPEDAAMRLTRILVPIDFSDYSKLALGEAINIAVAVKEASVICLHIYRVPQPYYSAGKTYHEMAEIMKSNAMKKFESFMSKIDAKGVVIKPAFALEERHEGTSIVNQYAKKEKADLLVVGAKGRTALAAALVGSFTEKLMADKTNIPLLIVKDRQNKFGLMEAIRNI